MALSAHLESLKTKHSQIDEQIRTLEKSPLPDSMQLRSLKRQKLQIKDQLQQMHSA